MNLPRDKPDARIKPRVSITLESELIEYAKQVGRGNASLGIRHALLKYRDIDPELCTQELSSHPGADSRRTAD
jgi:hypothetical protein